MKQPFLFKEQERLGHYFNSAIPTSVTGCAPMVFIHGAAGGAWYWKQMMQYFAQRGYPCYAIDLHSRLCLAQPLSSRSIQEYVSRADDFIFRIVRAQHAHPPILVGHSMGGLIAPKLAVKNSFHRIILITPAPPRGVRFLPGAASVSLRDAYRAVFAFATGGLYVPSRRLIESTFVNPSANKETIDMWAREHINESPRVLMDLFLSAVHIQRGSIKSPMLIIGAGQDRVIHPAVGPKIAAFYESEFMLIPHLGHMCPFEYGWEETARRCETWLLTEQ